MSNEPVPDRDNPEWTEEDFARAQPPAALPRNVLAAFPRTGRHGPVGRIYPAGPAIQAQGAGASLAALGA